MYWTLMAFNHRKLYSADMKVCVVLLRDVGRFSTAFHYTIGDTDE